jgi:hypothetical protein
MDITLDEQIAFIKEGIKIGIDGHGVPEYDEEVLKLKAILATLEKAKESEWIKSVWVVSSGCIYEGGGNIGIYKTEELARTMALKTVKDKNDWSMEANEKDDFKFEMFVEKEHNYWSNGIDYVVVNENEVESALYF